MLILHSHMCNFQNWEAFIHVPGTVLQNIDCNSTNCPERGDFILQFIVYKNAKLFPVFGSDEEERKRADFVSTSVISSTLGKHNQAKLTLLDFRCIRYIWARYRYVYSQTTVTDFIMFMYIRSLLVTLIGKVGYIGMFYDPFSRNCLRKRTPFCYKIKKNVT